MSTLDERESLIQQRQAEKYVNVIRMTVLAFLTATLFVKSFLAATAFDAFRAFPPFVLGAAWLYALAVQVAVSRGFFPRYLPWLTLAADLGFLALGFTLGWELSGQSSTILLNNLNWGYSLLFLLIMFSTLRERPALTLLTGVLCTLLYGLFLWLSLSGTLFSGFWDDQVFRLAFLLLASFFSTFHARSIRKAFQKAATSDRLRRQTDSRLKALALHFPGVLFQAEVAENKLSLKYVSEGSRPLLGFDFQELMADPELFFAHASPELRPRLVDRINSDDQVANAWEEEFLYTIFPQGERWLKLSVTTHRALRGPLVVNGLVSDVTEQRQTAEALREANQAKTDFLATMSHELRTPLNAILGNADHLARLADEDDDKKAFRDLQSSGETLLALIEDILVFSRLEAGRLVAEVRPFPWRSQLTAVVDAFRPLADAKALSLVTQFPDEAPTRIVSDGLRVRQVVANLIGNAVKFTPSGAVTLRVDFEQGWFVVSVSDTGIGIPQDSLEKIFEKFTQGEQGKSRTYGGLGLGLSISRSLAELLGGTVSVVSRPGEGSVFQLKIPVQVAVGTTDVGVPGIPLADEPVPTKILLVEDNLTNQDVATRMLVKLGGQVDVAPSGREAVELASKRFYDLIFMDWQMPVMDGREATAKIRALPGGQDLVIVALSGHALPGDRELLLASGFDDYLSKPVRMDDFRAILAKWVKSPRSPN